MTDNPFAAEGARLLAKIAREQGRSPERILLRSVNDNLYACQMWFVDEREADAFFIDVAKYVKDHKR